MRQRLVSALMVSSAIVSCALVAASAQAGDTLQFGAPAAWVKPHVIPAVAVPDQAAPFQVLLLDSQVNLDDGGVTTYTEIAYRINAPQGLQAAMMSIGWNPQTDTAVVHKVHVIRDGKVIDVLADGQTFSTMRRESNLEKSMLDGVLTAVLQPEDVQVGDIIDYSTSLTRNDPVMAGFDESVFSQATGSAVTKLTFRAQWPKSRPIRWRASNDKGAAKFKKTADGSEVTLDLDNYLPAKTIDDAPDRFRYPMQLEYSQFADWGAVSTLMAPLYARAETLKPDSRLAAEISKIKAAATDPKDQAAAALQLVQNKVRYLFLGMNQGGYVPADADVTWTRRFGDCKGKTALLLAILHGLGIKAEPALVSTVLGDGLDARLPMVAWFNHVIVRAEIGGKIYWLDGTRYGDRTLDSLEVPPFVWALPVRASGGALEALTATPPQLPLSETFLKIDASAGVNAPAPSHAEQIFRGDGAVELNTNMLSAQPADVDKYMRGFWEEKHEFITIDTVSWKWDQAAGELKMTMDGKAKMDWDALSDSTRIYEADGARLGWSSDLKRETPEGQKIPVAVAFPTYVKKREVIILPDGGKGYTLKGDSVDQTLGGFAFRRTLDLKDGVFTMETSSRAVTREITYKDAIAAQEPLKTLGKGRVFIKAPVDYQATEQDLKSVAGTKVETADDYLQRGLAFMTLGKTSEAAADFSAAIKLDPKNFRAYASRAWTRISTNDVSGATADIDAAAKLQPNEPMLFAARGALAMVSGDYESAVAAYSAALQYEPGNLMALQGRAGAYAMLGNKAGTRADLETALKAAPKSVQLLHGYAMALVEDNRLDKAADTLRQAIAIDPDDESLHITLGAVLSTCPLKDDKGCEAKRAEGMKEFDKAVALRPSATTYVARAQARPDSDRTARRADLEAALKLEPKSVDALLVQAGDYFQAKEYASAITAYTAVLALEDKNDFARVGRAQAYDEAGAYDKAIADLTVLVASNPKDGNWQNELCWSMATHGRDLQKGLEACNASIQLSPLPGHYDSRGLVYQQLGRYDEAIADYNVALTARPDMTATLYARGVARLRKGQTKEGQADIDKALKADPSVAKTYEGYGVKP